VISEVELSQMINWCKARANGDKPEYDQHSILVAQTMLGLLLGSAVVYQVSQNRLGIWMDVDKEGFKESRERFRRIVLNVEPHKEKAH